MKKIFSLILITLVIYYVLFTRDGSIRLCLLLSGYYPFVTYENIDYENNNPYLNQIEIDNKIIYIECKSIWLIKIATYYDFNN